MLYILFKIIAFFIPIVLIRLCIRVGILYTDGKDLHETIISLKGETWAYKSNLTPPSFIEVPVPNQEGQRSCICV